MLAFRCWWNSLPRRGAPAVPRRTGFCKSWMGNPYQARKWLCSANTSITGTISAGRISYSARFYSERQSAYAKRFGLDSVYTPQMVLDGTSEFVGSNSRLADKAFAKTLGIPKIPIHLSSISADASNTLHAHLEAGTLEASFGSPEAEVYVAVALNRAESRVSAGENAGHRLAHVSVVRSITKIGALKQGQVLVQDVQLKLEPGSDSRNLRLIGFVQEPRQGRVLGAASMPVSAP